MAEVPAGNDVGYLPRLTLSSLPWPLRALPRVRAQVAGFGDPDATDERFAGLGPSIQAIARGVRERAPDCRVLFIDYLTILPPGGAAAEAAGAEYVAASAASAGNHAWSATPWTRRFHLSLRGGAPYHPNAAGMAAVTELVVAALARAPGEPGVPRASGALGEPAAPGEPGTPGALA